MIGEHLLADLYGIAPEQLTDADALGALLGRALTEAGFTVLDRVAHAFPGEGAGATVLCLLSESHASLHTYPEYGYAAVDVFSCGDARPADVLEALRAALAPERVETDRRIRGARLAARTEESA
ncbi:MAG: adenosylmethionine decarboxylase [Planctomycetota bacterium]